MENSIPSNQELRKKYLLKLDEDLYYEIVDRLNNVSTVEYETSIDIEFKNSKLTIVSRYVLIDYLNNLGYEAEFTTKKLTIGFCK